MRPDGLPLSGTNAETRIAKRARYRTYCLLRVDNNDRKYKQAEGQTRGEDGASIRCGRTVDKSEHGPTGERFQSPHKDRKAKHPVDNGWNTSKVIDVGLNDAVEPVVGRILFQINCRAHTDGKCKQNCKEDGQQGTENGCTDPGSDRLAVLGTPNK